MKTLRTLLTAALALLLCLMTLASCGVTLEPGEEGLYDEDNQLYYSHASTVYEATALLEEYGKLRVTDKESYVLYTIPGMDGTEMLATEDNNVVYSNKVSMPTLLEMAPSALHICTDGATSVHELATINDTVELAALVLAYEDGESLTYPAATPLRSYKVRFGSVTYPGFYYTLTYVEYAEDLTVEDENYGKYFLYSAFDNRFVPVTDAIHKALGLDQE